jgi:hypothetical protein
MGWALLLVRVRVYDSVSGGTLQANGALVTREPQSIPRTRSTT